MRVHLVAGVVLSVAASASAQLQSLETKNFNVVYFGIERYLATHVARCFENALASHCKTFGYQPGEKVTILLHDFGDYGNAGATAIPNNRILVTIAPFSYTFEVVLGNERMNWLSSHELVHIVANDEATRRDRTYRSIFSGKVAPSSANPLSMVYSYLTAPRLFAPRWYHEGIAVFMETWLTGGLGRALGAYDEMVFRTMVAEGVTPYDLVGLESAAGKLDFQVGVNAYLYGTRFMSYTALTRGTDKLISWVARREGSKAWYSSQFANVFGEPLSRSWSEWIGWERGFQEKNLARLRENPITPYRAVTDRALGSVSRAALDRDGHTVYLGVNLPGQVAHLASLDLANGKMTRICDIKGPSLYAVTSLALDPDSRTLFYTINNNDWRDLRGVDLKTGHTRTYIKRGRIGDLAFDRADRSLWGMRHYNGISTIVRIAPPYSEWTQVYSWPYGTDLYDLDVSPDGKRLVGSLSRIDGSQSLVSFDVAKLLAGDPTYDVLSDFENSSPASFVFAADGRTLYGSSYYSGVSNIYRVDVETKQAEVMSNTDTGLFRPVPVSAAALLAFRYTSRGFQPVMLEPRPAGKVNSIDFLGQEVVNRDPEVKGWKLPPPSAVDLASLTVREGNYSPFATMKVRSLFPIAEGYKSYAAFGLHLDLSDDIGYNRLSLAASYSPTGSLPEGERLHLKAIYEYLNWKVVASHNNADFYDLFGPTLRSRKGDSLDVRYKQYLIYDEPNRYLDWVGEIAGYRNLDTLPEYQNVPSNVTNLGEATLSMGYKYVRSSLGAIEPEKGIECRATAMDDYASAHHFPRVWLDLDLGAPLPLPHSSLWLRTSAGAASGDRTDPLVDFYFGGFGNNYVDDKPYRRYHEQVSFPGVDLNSIGGKNYAKAFLEWNVPPLVFTHVGTPALFVNWASLAVFGGGIETDLNDAATRRKLASVGAQLDIRFVAMSHHQFTLSLGAARAYEKGQRASHELMASLRLPVYE